VDSLFIHGGRASVAPTKFPVMCIQNRVTRCPVGARLVRPMNLQTASKKGREGDDQKLTPHLLIK